MASESGRTDEMTPVDGVLYFVTRRSPKSGWLFTDICTRDNGRWRCGEEGLIPEVEEVVCGPRLDALEEASGVAAHG